MNIRCKLVHVSFWQFRVDDTTDLHAVCDCGIPDHTHHFYCVTAILAL